MSRNLSDMNKNFALSGVWIIGGTDVFYNQFTTVTFMCPMRYEKFPLDSHICKFRVGSTNIVKLPSSQVIKILRMCGRDWIKVIYS